MYYIIGDMMHIKKFDPNKIKIDQHSLKKYSYLPHWIHDP